MSRQRDKRGVSENLPTVPKLYYSIGEVSELTGVEPHTLRYWEVEFKELSPRKNRGGKRLYRDADIQVIQVIKQLLYQRKYTIEGARRWLKETPRAKWAQMLASREEDLTALLSEIREGLMQIKELLSSSSQP